MAGDPTTVRCRKGVCPPPPALRVANAPARLRPGGEPYATFAKTIDLLGDGTVRLISTPGHTVGHMSVLLRVAGDRRVLVVGDAAYTLRNIREEILPLLTADDETSVQSLRELKAFADSEPEAILVPSHDPSAWHEASPRGGETMMAWAPAQRPIRRTASASVGA